MRRLVGLAADLDIKPSGLGSMEQAECVIAGIADVLQTPPSLVIESGHGLQPVWAVDTADPDARWQDQADLRAQQARRLVAGFGVLVREVARAHGGAVDPVFDLARLLRVPGTVNWKFASAPVQVGLRVDPDRPTSTVDQFRDRLGQRVRASSSPRAASATRYGCRPEPSAPSGWLSRLPGGPICDIVAEVASQLAGQLKPGGRHAAILNAVLQLLRLGAYGHHGVGGALTQLEDAFRASVASDAAHRGVQGEWDRALQGAVTKFQRTPLRENPACACVIEALRELIEDDGPLSAGQRRNNERKVLRALVARAAELGSMQVSISHRQFAELIDIPFTSMGPILDRLQDLGWLTRTTPGGGKATVVTLAQPRTGKLLTTRRPAEREETVKTVKTPLHARVHALFGSDGLGPGVMETFALLSEHAVPHGHGRLLRVRKGSPASAELLNPYSGSRQIPRPSPGGEGRTASELASLGRRDPTTVRRHLRVLEEHGLALKTKGRWWRLRFSPSLVQVELGIQDTARRRVAQHQHDRASYYGLLAQVQPDRCVRVEAEFELAYVEPQSGVVLWRTVRDGQASPGSRHEAS